MSTIACVNRLTNYYGEDQSIALGNEAKISLNQYQVIYRRYYEPVSRENLIKEFYQLASEWRRDTKYTSSITEICMHPAYQKIIGMGEKVLPLIFHDLKQNPSHWFWALNAITGADPIESSQRGRIDQMISSWFKWAKDKGIKW